MRRIAVVIILVISQFSYIPNIAIAAVGDSDTSMVFNGTSTTFQVADANTLDISGAITMEAWAKPTGITSSGYHMVLNKESAYELWIVNGYWNYALNGSSGWLGVNTGIAAINDQWQHVAAVRSANTSSVNFYFNGELVFTGSADGVGTGSIYNSALPFQVGSRSSAVGSGFSAYFKGELDEIRVFNTARTADQIKSDMTTYGSTNTTGLVMYFDFNDYASSLANRSTSAAAGPSSLTAYGTNVIGYIETTTVTANRKVVEFSRTYLSVNGWKVPSGIREVWALVIGGGGGGGSDEGGGGGAGGFVEDKSFAVTPNSAITVIVGGGGAGATDASALAGGNGADSQFGSLIAYGGGGGGSGLNTPGIAERNGKNGGSGGGGGGENVSGAGSAGTGISGQGFDGGVGRPSGTVRGGGGGGAGEVGNTDGDSAGGDGLSSTIEDGVTAIFYAGGGSGGGGNTVAGAVVGGSGGGGTGGGTNATPTDGLAGTGGGGGGGSIASYRNYAGFTGGTGTIILAFTAFPVEVSSISNASFRTSSPLVVTLIAAGKVTFYAGNKKIPQCINVSTVSSISITATCNWKPSQRGYVSLTAKFVPTSSPSTSSTISIGRVNVTARSGTR